MDHFVELDAPCVGPELFADRDGQLKKCHLCLAWFCADCRPHSIRLLHPGAATIGRWGRPGWDELYCCHACYIFVRTLQWMHRLPPFIVEAAEDRILRCYLELSQAVSRMGQSVSQMQGILATQESLETDCLDLDVHGASFLVDLSETLHTSCRAIVDADARIHELRGKLLGLLGRRDLVQSERVQSLCTQVKKFADIHMEAARPALRVAKSQLRFHGTDGCEGRCL